MSKRILLFSLLLAALLSLTHFGSQAQEQDKSRYTKKAYFSTGMDGYILSTALQQKDGEFLKFSTPRFSAFVHLGLNINYDFNKHIGLFTGINVKNIGFIEKYNNPDSTVKRRTYTFGIPLALKLGNVQYGSYFIVGGGIDFPFNYKEKGFIKRSHKTKFNEWFSDRTPAAMPYFFVGAHLRPLMTIKLQYYPGNFLNPDYQQSTASGIIEKPYERYNVQLAMLTVGFDISYRPK